MSIIRRELLVELDFLANDLVDSQLVRENVNGLIDLMYA